MVACTYNFKYAVRFYLQKAIDLYKFYLMRGGLIVLSHLCNSVQKGVLVKKLSKIYPALLTAMSYLNGVKWFCTFYLLYLYKLYLPVEYCQVRFINYYRISFIYLFLSYLRL